jgi:hypothetical protein
LRSNGGVQTVLLQTGHRRVEGPRSNRISTLLVV